ncbi:MAG: recombinase family protein [Schaedlerella sp.]|nr:recombinase family protein [Schaedlerella sp.]
MGKLRVAAYCRVSTESDEQANSLQSQRKYFEEYIRGRTGWELVEIYYDEGISGTQTKKRAGFNRMIKEALEGNIDLILTKEVSRFARNTVDTLSYTRKLKEHGVGVIFSIDNIDTRDADGELRLTIMASLAQEESRKTSARVKWGQHKRMQDGVVFGRDLLGYTVKNGKLIINEAEAPIVRAIFHKYTNEGKGSSVIARELREEGMRPKRMSLWSNVVVLRVLKNEKYVGDLCQKKTYTPDYLNHKKKYNRGEEEMVYIYDHHEPIIGRDLWNRTQEELSRRSPPEHQKRKYSNRYWCSGKLYCGLCDNRYVGRKKKRKDGSQYKAWRCYVAANHGTSKLDADGKEVGCDNQMYNEQTLLSAVKYCVRQIRINRDQIKKEVLEEIKSIQNRTVEDTEKENLEKEIQKYKNKKRKAMDLLLSDVISKTDAMEQNAWYDEEIADLEKRMELYDKEERIKKTQAKEMETYLEVLDEIMEYNTEEAGNHELFYGEVLEKMVLFPKGKIQVYLKYVPFEIELKVRSSGKREKYKTEILEMKILEIK